jgi:poly-gamma-glutamate capsule biosynthesis protein CapA/YwtB (metallophosphatase superfamily)
VERRGRRVVAYSLGNFVWAAGSPFTSRTGILRLRLSARGVEGARLRRAYISNTRPALIR